MPELQPRSDLPGLRFGIVVARFNKMVTERLLAGALRGFKEHGFSAEAVDIAWVPGSFELPVVAARMARSGHYGAIVCLGAVIQGETAHFEHVSREAAVGIAAASRETGVPVMFGVQTTSTLEQALARAGGTNGDKGYEAAEGAVEMARLMAALPSPRDDVPDRP